MISNLVNRLSSPSPCRTSRSSSSKSNSTTTSTSSSSSSSHNIFTRSRSSNNNNNANNFNKFKRTQFISNTNNRNETKIQVGAPSNSKNNFNINNHNKQTNFIYNNNLNHHSNYHNQHLRIKSSSSPMSNSSPSSISGSPSHTSALPPIPTSLFSSKLYITSPNNENYLNKPFETMKLNDPNNEMQIESENVAAQSIFYSNNQELNVQTVVIKKEIDIEKLIPTTEQQKSQARFADEPEYRMDHKRRGFAIIINNKIFDTKLEMPKREGTDKDAASLESALTKLGFDIRLFHNCTALTMRDLLMRYAKADHSDADCFMCVVMSHGEDGVIYGVDKEIEIEQLIQPFKYNRTLAGKPKLFFIQACRGTKLMEGIDSNPFEVNYVSKIPMEADFLIGYSTIAGYFSWRNSANGSWFIQSLCQVLNEYGKTLEIMQLLTAVNRSVAYHYQSNTTDPQMHGKRQVPCIVTMLTKELYFKPKQTRYPHTLTVNYN